MRILHRALVSTTLPALVVLVVGAFAVYFGLQRGFLDYVAQLEASRLTPARERIAEEFEATGNLDRFVHDRGAWQRVLEWKRPGGRPRAPAPPSGPAPTSDPMELTHRVSLYDADGALVVGRGGAPELRLPIEVEGRVVAELGVRPIARLEREIDVDYMRGQGWMLALVGTVGFALALLVGGALARRLARPISTVAAAARELARGEFATRVEVVGNDELTELAQDFNAMAASLADAEARRQRWVADTSHELRTPLAILQGEIEALVDGVYDPTQPRLRSLHDEVRHLGKLVDDLDMLARADRRDLPFDMAQFDLAELTADVVARHRPRIEEAGLQLTAELPPALLLHGDRERLAQLISNLLENSRRYTEPGGRVVVGLDLVDGQARLAIEDSTPTVPPHALPRLFERFFRPDESRNRSLGGSGLGLSICKRITEAHSGRIHATKSELGGLAILVELPVTQPHC